MKDEEDNRRDEAREFLREFLLKLSEADETNQQILYVQSQILRTNVELVRAIADLTGRIEALGSLLLGVRDPYAGLDEFEEL